jgi:hypothetical protein
MCRLTEDRFLLWINAIYVKIDIRTAIWDALYRIKYAIQYYA